MATILATVNILKAGDENGQEITPTPEVSGGMIRCVHSLVAP